MEAHTNLCDNMELDIEHETLCFQIEDEESDEDDQLHELPDQDDDADDIVEMAYRYSKTLRIFIKSQPCHVCIYVSLALLLLSSIIAVAVVAVVIVVPYSKTNGFHKTLCKPIYTVQNPRYEQCSCGKGCHAKYPCVRITVQIILYDSDFNHTWTSTLTEDENALKQQVNKTKSFSKYLYAYDNIL